MLLKSSVMIETKLVKGWSDIRDIPVPPKSKDNFRNWYKNHQTVESVTVETTLVVGTC